MVRVLEKSMVQEIERIGQLRYPNEACGLLLSEPYRGKWIWEMPNRSSTPSDSFTLSGQDIMIALEEYLPAQLTEEFLQTLTVWHTHPGGNLGPSASDLKCKPKHFKNLVVTLYEDAPAKPTWF